jgi:hypothetical protein
MHLGRGIHHRTGMDAARPALLVRLPPLGGTREIGIRIGRDNAGATLRRFIAHRRRHNDTGRL